MKRKTVLLFSFLVFCRSLAFANFPRLNYSAAYVYQYAPSWDKIIQTYNFSRSFNAQQLGLFISGYELQAGYQINLGGRGLTINPELSYQRFSSLAKNNGLRLRASINSYTVHSNIGWSFGKSTPRKIILAIDPACTFLNPSLRVDRKEIDIEKTKKYHELSVAFRLGMELSYRIPVEREKRTIVLQPFLRGDWYPEAELFDFAAALNGSYIEGLKDYGRVYQLSAGIRVSFRKAAKK